MRVNRHGVLTEIDGTPALRGVQISLKLYALYTEKHRMHVGLACLTEVSV